MAPTVVGVGVGDCFDANSLARGVDVLTGGHLNHSFFLPRGVHPERNTDMTLVLQFDTRHRARVLEWLNLPFGERVPEFYSPDEYTVGLWQVLPDFTIADVPELADPYLRLWEQIGHLGRIQWLQESLEYVLERLIAQQNEADARALIDELSRTLAIYRQVPWSKRPDPIRMWAGDICPILETHQEDEHVPYLVAALTQFARGMRQPTLLKLVIAGIVAERNMHGALYAAEDLMAFAEWQPQGRQYLQHFIDLAKQAGRSLQQGLQFRLNPQPNMRLSPV